MSPIGSGGTGIFGRFGRKLHEQYSTGRHFPSPSKERVDITPYPLKNVSTCRNPFSARFHVFLLPPSQNSTLHQGEIKPSPRVSLRSGSTLSGGNTYSNSVTPALSFGSSPSNLRLTGRIDP